VRYLGEVDIFVMYV